METNHNKHNKMKSNRILITLEKYSDYIAITLFAILFFVLFFGLKTLDVTNINWLTDGNEDRSQHYWGWVFYRRDSWHFPVGDFTGLSYPNRMSVIFMDSIPLVAFFLKILSPILPGTFQYFGWYQLLCFILQGVMAVGLLKKYLKNRVTLFCFGALFVACPVFLWRCFKHIALASQWIILLSLYSLVYYREYFRNLKRCIAYWFLTGFLCLTIHLYFLPMCFIIFLGFLILDIHEYRKIRIEQFGYLVSLVLGVLIPMLLLGGIVSGMNVGNSNIEWKKSLNLNSFYNPQKWSRILPNLENCTNGQSEGFAYLGLGVFFIIAAVMIIFGVHMLKNRGGHNLGIITHPKTAAFAIVVILSILAAVSPVVTYGTEVMFEVPVPKTIENMWSIFRCCGRLAWPAVYILMITPAIICRNLKYQKVIAVAAAAALILQCYDISEKAWDRGRYCRVYVDFENELASEGWSVLGDNEEIKNVVYVSIGGMTKFSSMANFADQYGKNLSRFYYARSYDDSETLRSYLADKNPENIYLFSLKDAEGIWREADGLYYYYMDDMVVGYCQDIKELEEYKLRQEDVVLDISCTDIPADAQNTEMTDGFMFVHGGGRISLPPYAPLSSGRFWFAVEGENLLDAQIEATGSYRIVRHEMQTVVLELNCNSGEEVQIVVNNPSDHDMVLYQVSVTLLEYQKENL